MNLATRRLPRAVSRQGLRVRRSSDDLLMIFGFGHPPEQYAPTFLAGWLDQSLRESLLTTPGVGDVRVFGSSDLSFRLWLDPDRLEQANLTISDVSRALAEQNVLAAIGSLGASPAPDGQLISLPVDAEGRLLNQKDFENLILRRLDNGGLLRLKDVGRVSGQRSYGSQAMNLDGERLAVGLYQRDGANALDVSRAVKAELKTGTQLPARCRAVDDRGCGRQRPGQSRSHHRHPARRHAAGAGGAGAVSGTLAPGPDPWPGRPGGPGGEPGAGEAERIQPQQPDSVRDGAGHWDRCR